MSGCGGSGGGGCGRDGRSSGRIRLRFFKRVKFVLLCSCVWFPCSFFVISLRRETRLLPSLSLSLIVSYIFVIFPSNFRSFSFPYIPFDRFVL